MRNYHWFLIIGVLVIGYIIFRGDGDRYTQPQPQPQPQTRLNFNTVAVSQGMTRQARALNLEKQLDVSLLPEIGKASIREAAGKGLKEQAFLQAVMRDVVGVPRAGENWATDNPANAAEDFAVAQPEFVIEQPAWPFSEATLKRNVTHYPSAWLKRA